MLILIFAFYFYLHQSKVAQRKIVKNFHWLVWISSFFLI